MNREEYQEWICSQTSDKYRIITGFEREIRLETDYATGFVVFYDQDIVELMIKRKENSETCFYLHFQLKDEEHAKNLFREMTEVLIGLQEHKKLRILLTCSSALTTSFYAQELNKAAETLQLDYVFSAVSFSHIYEKGFDYDVILLAPQIQYEYPKVKEIFKDQIVLKIPTSVFARYSTGGLIELIMQEKNEYDREREAIRIKKADDPFENEYRILTLCLINHKNMYRFGYRIYDHGKRTLDKEVIKPTFGLSDIEDLMDYIVARHKNIDAISLAVPGVTYHGTLNHRGYGFINLDFGIDLTNKYGIPVILINDVNALALGYHAIHEEEKNMVFYFQPRGYAQPGAGVIINDRLYTGRLHAAGEIGYAVRAFVDHPDDKIMTPEGAMEVVCAGLISYIAAIAPEKIILYSELTPNVDEIKAYISRSVDEKYIPDIRHVTRLKKYMLPGAMIHCMDVFKEMPEWTSQVRKKNHPEDRQD